MFNIRYVILNIRYLRLAFFSTFSCHLPYLNDTINAPPFALTLKEDHGCVSILSDDDALAATGPISLASHTLLPSLPLMWFLNRFLDHFAGLHFSTTRQLTRDT